MWPFEKNVKVYLKMGNNIPERDIHNTCVQE